MVRPAWAHRHAVAILSVLAEVAELADALG